MSRRGVRPSAGVRGPRPATARPVALGGEGVPVVVDPDWCLRQSIEGLGTAALLTYPDGTIRFEHRCDRGPRGVIVCAPALQIGNGHTVLPSSHDGPTITPSVLCSDCGTHGWIRDGVWTSA